MKTSLGSCASDLGECSALKISIACSNNWVKDPGSSPWIATLAIKLRVWGFLANHPDS